MCFDLDTGECTTDIKPGPSFHDTIRPSGYPPNKAYDVTTPAEWKKLSARHRYDAWELVRRYAHLQYRQIEKPELCPIPAFCLNDLVEDDILEDMPLCKIPAWIQPELLIEPVSPPGGMVQSSLHDESAVASTTHALHEATDAPEAAADVAFKVIVPEELPVKSPALVRRLATPRERTEASKHLPAIKRKSPKAMDIVSESAEDNIGPPAAVADVPAACHHRQRPRVGHS